MQLLQVGSHLINLEQIVKVETRDVGIPSRRDYKICLAMSNGEKILISQKEYKIVEDAIKKSTERSILHVDYSEPLDDNDGWHHGMGPSGY